MENNQIKITVMKNGPLLADGNLKLLKQDGEQFAERSKVALCRCGASVNKPYCDGSHYKIDFKG